MTIDPQVIINTFSLIIGSDNVTELRALDAVIDNDRYPTTYSGYFNDPHKLADAVGKIKNAKGIYFTPNPVDPTLLARANNRIRKAPKGESTQDTDVTRRHWLLIDCDAQRPSGISATDAEHDAALERVQTIASYLRGHGWPDPLMADSGNGGHLLYRIDLPADDGGLIKRCLEALSKGFDDDAVKVDQTVHNPARIWKLYGTLACKGDDTPDRPHRLSKILSKPDTLKTVPVAMLETLAAEVNQADERPSQATDGRNNKPYDVQGFIDRNGLDTSGPEPWNGMQGQGQRWVLNTDPMDGTHNDGSCFILQHASGAISAGCHHNSATWDWRDLRAKHKPMVQNADQDDLWSQRSLLSHPWPDPIDEAAYHGLAGEIIRAIEPHTEADPVALLIDLLVSFGSMVGRNCYFVADGANHYPNLFAVMVGKTSKGRKGTSRSQINRVVEPIDPGWSAERIQGGLSSGEGLIWAVRDPIMKREPVKEKGRHTGEYQEVEADAGVADKRLLVIEGEFAAVLSVAGRDGSTLSTTIRQAWDTGTLRTLTKNSPAKATDAHISIIGHITRDELRRRLDSTEAANGFGNRHMWFCVQRSKYLPEGGNINKVNFSKLRNRLMKAVEFGKQQRELKRDDKARAIWIKVYTALSEGKPGMFGALTSRAEAQVMRVAMVFALLDCSTVINAAHLQAALAVWEYAEQSVVYTFGDALGDPIADELLAALRRAGTTGMTRTDIRDHFKRHKGKDEINRALGLLFDKGYIRRETKDTEGRPVEVWFAVC